MQILEEKHSMSAVLAVLMARNLKKISIYFQLEIKMSRIYKDRFELRGETNVADLNPGSEILCLFDPWIQDPEYVASGSHNCGYKKGQNIYFTSFVAVVGSEISYPRSGMDKKSGSATNISDSQHRAKLTFFSSL